MFKTENKRFHNKENTDYVWDEQEQFHEYPKALKPRKRRLNNYFWCSKKYFTYAGIFSITCLSTTCK